MNEKIPRQEWKGVAAIMEPEPNVADALAKIAEALRTLEGINPAARRLLEELDVTAMADPAPESGRTGAEAEWPESDGIADLSILVSPQMPCTWPVLPPLVFMR